MLSTLKKGYKPPKTLPAQSRQQRQRACETKSCRKQAHRPARAPSRKMAKNVSIGKWHPRAPSTLSKRHTHAWHVLHEAPTATMLIAVFIAACATIICPDSLDICVRQSRQSWQYQSIAACADVVRKP